MTKRKSDPDTENLNTSEAKPGGSNGGPPVVAGDKLKAYYERIERLETEKKALADDIKEIYLEAKGNGFEPSVMKKVLRLKNMKAADREEEEALLEVYKKAIGL